MLKVALIVAAVMLAASTSMATTLDVVATAAATPACHSIQSLDPACATRTADTDGDGTISATELASFTAPAPAVIDWTSLRPPGTGLDFKDAAIEADSMLPATLEHDGSHPLVPALFALGALVVLLRQRPV